MNRFQSDISIDELVSLVSLTDTVMHRKLDTMLSPSVMRAGGEEHRKQLEALLRQASAHHLKDVMLHRLQSAGLSVGRSLSFMNSIVVKSELSRLGEQLAGWELDSKKAAYEFVDLLEVPRPRDATSSKPLDLIEAAPGCVIKPEHGSGSTGVFLYLREGEIFHAKDGQKFQTWNEAKRHAQKVTRGELSSWLTEELVFRDKGRAIPATDLKFWMFYGEIGFISEISRYPSTVWDFWDSFGNRIDNPGVWKYSIDSGSGVTETDIETVRMMSSEIPYPFMRIDMLKGEDNSLYFGEFTPRPGSSNGFKPEWDRYLGQLWARAENRLQSDLLEGKSFDCFKQFRMNRIR